MIRRKEETVSEPKTLPPCTRLHCQDHKIPSTSVDEEINLEASLSENKINSKSNKKKLSKKRKNKEQDVEHPLSTEKQITTEVVTPKKTLPHPIMLKIKKNFREQIKCISEKFPNIQNRIVNDVVKMFTNDHEEYRTIIHFLESDKEFEFYVIKRNNFKPIKAVIKGLPSSSKIADITNDLAEIGFQIDSCTQLLFLNEPKNPSPIFL
ncbi:hypothetical protein TNCV_4156321 [Trichonephila clavipes]|nr:hypothetical protein TNCV_4156321 [Trichonephila clavipes]